MAAASYPLDEQVTAVGTKYPKLRGINLKEHQRTVIEHVLARKNCFVSLPTGYGKSLTYVLPSLILDENKGSKSHTSLVITPLLNLMRQQASRLQDTGVAAICVSADMTAADNKVLMGGKAQVIFSTPEAAVHPLFKTNLRKLYKDRLSVIATDESHCISQWGENFRTAYRRLPELTAHFDVPFLFVTATATQKIQTDILDLFNMKDAEMVVILPDRPEIRLDVHKTAHSFKVLNWCIERVREQGLSAPKTVIFTNSIRESGDLYEYMMEELNDKAFLGGKRQASERFIEMYHSAVSDEREEYIMTSFPQKDTKIRLLASTIRLGMGVDIADIDTVVIFGAPNSIVDLWQESGRCARGQDRTGLAVIYLTGRTTSIKLKKDQWMRGLENPEGCHRLHILQGFAIRGLDKMFVPPTDVCENTCRTRCNCTKCRCCNRCAESCLCPQKDIRECCGKVETVSDPEDDDGDDENEDVQSD